MANWLEEMIARIVSSPEFQHPGYTQSQMMANQGPMGTPMQSPEQYDIPFAIPYGENSVIRESDIERPLGAGGNWLRPSNDLGAAMRSDLITVPMAQREMDSRIDPRMAGDHARNHIAGWNGALPTQAIDKQRALEYLLSVARKSSEKAIKYDQSRRKMAKYK